MDLECGGSVRNPGAGSTAKPGIINGLSMAFDPRSLQPGKHLARDQLLPFFTICYVIMSQSCCARRRRALATSGCN
jgi:hypothetical protein